MNLSYLGRSEQLNKTPPISDYFCDVITLPLYCEHFPVQIIMVRKDPEGADRVVCVPGVETRNGADPWMDGANLTRDEEQVQRKPTVRDRTKSSLV